MTERFVIDEIGTCILDNSTKEDNGIVYYDCTDERINDLCDLLNELNDENQRLKYHNEHQQRHINQLLKKPKLTDVLPQAAEIIEANDKLEKENDYIKQTIQDMLETERTSIGQSVLKQLLEAIQ